MSELSQHIEALLLTHDCVVIPQLGAFVTQWIEASRADDEALLFPPQRSLRFNTSITTDDGLLVHSIRHTYRMAEADAKRKVQTLVLDLRQQLLADGQADFGALGQFTQDEDGVVAFESCSAGTVTPSYYGLDTIVFPRLQTAAKARSNRLGNAQEHRSRLFYISSTGGDIDIHIGHKLVRYTGVAAALIAIFFLLPTHLGMSPQTRPAEASIAPIAHEQHATAAKPVAKQAASVALQTATEATEPEATAQAAQPQASEACAQTAQPHMSEATAASTPTATAATNTKATTAAAVPTASDAVLSTATTAAKQAQTPAAKQAQAQQAAPSHPTTTYAIVLASAIPLKRAESYAAQLTQQGLTGVRVRQSGKMVRVVMDGFLSEARAREQISELHELSDEFASAWLLKIED